MSVRRLIGFIPSGASDLGKRRLRFLALGSD